MRAVLIALVLSALCFASCDSGPTGSVVGKWKEQSGAAWEFKPDGHVTIKDNADATYKLLDAGTLQVDYHSGQHLVVTYKYELSTTKLILTPDTATGDPPLPRDWETPTVLVRAG